MQSQFVKILAILMCQIWSSFGHGRLLGMNTCMENQTLAIQILATVGEDMTCKCQTAPVSDLDFREDYTYFPGLGAYKFHTEVKTWNVARKICNEENAHLAIINSMAEENVMLDMFKKESAIVHGARNPELTFLGLHDLYEEGEWVTIFGESIYSTGYTKWSSQCFGPQPDNEGGNENCAALNKKCGSMDDISCRMPLSFFCEKPIPCAIQTSFAARSGHMLDDQLAS